MQFVGIPDYDKYFSLLINDISENKNLLDSLSVNVTRFFRNKEVWEKLGSEIIPKISEDSKLYQPIKIWSAGCASGEEAYTIATIFKEFSSRPFTIYATDRNPKAIEVAKNGIYKKDQFEEFPANLFKKYVEPAEDGKWKIRKDEFKSAITFAVGDLMNPPIKNLDMIFCRNVMIYFDTKIKDEYYKIFYDALKPKGFLSLGLDEFMVGTYSKESFSHILIDQRMYQRK